MSYWDEIEEIARRAWGAVMADNKAPVETDLKELTASGVYWRGKYEESKEAQQQLAEMVKSQLHHLSTAQHIRGSIGAGSTIYQGVDSQTVGVPFGVAALVVGIAGFITFGAEVATGGLAVSLASFAAAALPLFRRERKKST